MKKKIFTKKEIKKITGASRSQKINAPFYYAPSYLDKVKQLFLLECLRLPYRYLEGVQGVFGLDNKRISKILGTTEKSLAKMKESGQLLSVEISVKLHKIAWLAIIAEEVFESEKVAVEWLSRPQSGLGDKIPINLLKTEKGMKEVVNLLNRIEHDIIV